MLNIGEIEKATNGKIINGDSLYIPKNYEVNSKLIGKDDFFIPIVGEKVDGHSFIIESVLKGCNAFFIEKENKERLKIIQKAKEINSDVCIIEVENSKKALYDAGKYNRQKHIDIPVVAITGSVGKTSTREMIASILEKEKKVLTTQKNYNSYIGIPMMVLKMEDQDVCVFEVGIDHFGEMELDAQLLKPDVVVMTMIGTAHIASFKTQENIFKEKIKIRKYIKGMRKMVLNADDKFLEKVKTTTHYDVINYTKKDSVNIVKDNISITYKTKIYGKENKVIINQIGNHNILNSLCAIKVGEIFNISEKNILKGVFEYKNFSRRLETKKIKNDIILIDDTYNASFDSMMSGLATIDEISTKRKIAVLGDMLELGENAAKMHFKVGKLFEKYKFNYLIAVGKFSKEIVKGATNYIVKENIFWFEKNEDALNKIIEIMQSGDIIYFKASNGMKFDTIIKKIEKDN
ncbi:MAG: UDP-N-acetylmuramoyl-tripeptide--D-alanyl-D-alanine ligase [Clostridia bacterium]